MKIKIILCLTFSFLLETGGSRVNSQNSTISPPSREDIIRLQKLEKENKDLSYQSQLNQKDIIFLRLKIEEAKSQVKAKKTIIARVFKKKDKPDYKKLPVKSKQLPTRKPSAKMETFNKIDTTIKVPTPTIKKRNFIQRLFNLKNKK